MPFLIDDPIKLPLRACPWCASVSTETACSKHGQNALIPTLTHEDLFDRLRTVEAGSAGIQEALAALILAEQRQRVMEWEGARAKV